MTKWVPNYENAPKWQGSFGDVVNEHITQARAADRLVREVRTSELEPGDQMVSGDQCETVLGLVFDPDPRCVVARVNVLRAWVGRPEACRTFFYSGVDAVHQVIR